MKLTPKQTARTVANALGVSAAHLDRRINSTNERAISHPRMLAANIIHHRNGVSWRKVADMFGYSNHSCALTAANRYADLVNNWDELAVRQMIVAMRAVFALELIIDQHTRLTECKYEIKTRLYLML